MIDLSTNVQRAKYQTAEASVAKKILAALNDEYPGYGWYVDFSEDGGSVLTILALALSGREGYKLHTDQIHPSRYIEACKLAGGEILERFGQRRGRADQTAIDAANRDRRGNVHHA